MEIIKLFSLVATVILVVGIFSFMLLSIQKNIEQDDSIEIKNPIREILLNKLSERVSLEGTIIKVGNYVWVENDSWAIRIINGSKTEDNFSYLSFGNRVNIQGITWQHEFGQMFLNISDLEILSKDFDIEPIEIKNLTRYPDRFVEIKNQNLLNYSNYLGRGEEFWSIEFESYESLIPGFTSYIALIPKSHKNIFLSEGENYDLVGIVHHDGTIIWLTELI